MARSSKWDTHYKCRNCGNRGLWILPEEALRSVNGQPRCPNCGLLVATKPRAWRTKNQSRKPEAGRGAEEG